MTAWWKILLGCIQSWVNFRNNLYSNRNEENETYIVEPSTSKFGCKIVTNDLSVDNITSALDYPGSTKFTVST